MYQEIQPTERLSEFIECLWRSEPDSTGAGPESIRVLPDGCIDLIFDITPHRENAFWAGTMTTSLCLENVVPRSLWGIRFHPGGARQLLPCPAAELVDTRTPIGVLTPALAPLLESLVEQRDLARTLPRTLHGWLESRIVPTTGSRFVRSIHRRLAAHKSVSTIAEEMGCSRQYINRVMKDAVGIDLKRFSRIIRMRKLTAALAGANTPIDWSDCAVSFGFYDQSHLINEFRDLAGVTPGEFLKGLR